MPSVKTDASELPGGVYAIGDIEIAVNNLVISQASRLPRRSGKSKIKSNRLTLVDGISKYLLRRLLFPKPLGERALEEPYGKSYLSFKGSLIPFDEENRLISGEVDRPTMADFLFLDTMPDNPPSLEGGVDADDAYAHYGTLVRGSMLCVDPQTWCVRRCPLFSLDSFVEYVAQSGFPSRFDFEFEEATETWQRVQKYSGGRLVYSFEQPKHPGKFKRPSEIAKLLEKELQILFGLNGGKKGAQQSKSELYAQAYLNEFRSLPQAKRSGFNQSVALSMSVAGHLPYRSKSDKGFRSAWDKFLGELSEDEHKIVPGPGRPKKEPG